MRIDWRLALVLEKAREEAAARTRPHEANGDENRDCTEAMRECRRGRREHFPKSVVLYASYIWFVSIVHVIRYVVLPLILIFLYRGSND